VWDLQEAVSIMGSAQLGISLTPSDIKKIETFLRTTTGVQPKIIYPILPAPTKNTPLPIIE
jgi:cytochrome c peroxidase